MHPHPSIDKRLFWKVIQKRRLPLNLPVRREGDIVIADNLSSHKTPDARKMIESVGCRLIFLQPYSPDYNPIEEMWAKIKEHLRTAEAQELNVLYEAIAEAFTKVSQSDCQGFFKYCGYG